MKKNYGKSFEHDFKRDFLATVPESTIDRLYDTVNGYESISNISDFIGYSFPNIYYLECKTHRENTFPFSKLTQYDDLAKKVGIRGVRAGVVIWFVDHDRIVYVPISTITKMKKNGDKSVNIRTLGESGYDFREIPVVKKVVYLNADYSCLRTLRDGE